MPGRASAFLAHRVYGEIDGIARELDSRSWLRWSRPFFGRWWTLGTIATNTNGIGELSLWTPAGARGMKSTIWRLISFFTPFKIFRTCNIAVALVFAATAADAQQVGTQTPQRLVEGLTRGGYIVFLRHAATDHSQEDLDLSDFSRCELQRNLSTRGKEESRILGAAFTALNIRVDRVETSPYCRCVDTARIAFKTYEIVDDMRATFFTDEKETKYLAGVLRSRLSKPPRDGYNTVLVGHTANLRDVTRVWPKPEGVAHIFKPLGNEGFEHLGRILPTEWGPLAGVE